MSTPVPAGAERRVAAVVAAVVRQALADAGATVVHVQAPDTPAGALLLDWLVGAGLDAVPAGPEAAAGGSVLDAHPADKTWLLLAGAPPTAALLPLGDLWGSRVAALASGWQAPPAVAALVERCGGVDALDGALMAWIDGRAGADDALHGLPAGAASALREAFEEGRLHRRRAGLVPKLGGRTVGIDLFD
ncbi:MAG: hypothetical protein WEB88_14450 [Gemmatimonadota bacterium]